MSSPSGWTPQQLEQIATAHELRIAVARPDGTWPREVPVWAVRVDGSVYVRTWYRRDTGWYGGALRSQRARISVPGLSAEVAVSEVGSDRQLRAAVDDAYRAKYAPHGDSVGGMTTDEAASTTLRLSPADPA